MRIRRPRRLFFQLRDRSAVDLASLLHGKIETITSVELIALPPASGKICALDQAELGLLASLSSECWVPAEEVELTPERLETLIDCGVLISDDEEETRIAFRQRDAGFERYAWGDIAGLLYGVASFSGIAPTEQPDLADITAGSPTAYRRQIDRHGLPPPAFHRPKASSTRIRLPPPSGLSKPFDHLLGRRRTIRAFDRERPLAIRDLGQLLYSTFGCLSTTEMTEGITLLKRSSPSGGSLHPVEAYPLLLNVESVASGLYHYNSETHSLDLMRQYQRKHAEEMATRFVAGQRYAADAHLLILLTARFARAFWKYRASDRAFLVVAMDAGHLGQTFYLACTELGVGPFFSAAIDADAIIEALDLDPTSEGPLAACGCGWPAPGADGGLERVSFPHTPR